MDLEEVKSKSVDDLREEFFNLRNTLAGIASGITRDETLTEEVLKFLFCKLKADKEGINLKSFGDFKSLFKQVCKSYPSIFKGRTSIKLDQRSSEFLIDTFSSVNLTKVGKNPISDLVEIFINSTVRGAEGQFFTPSNAVDLVLSILNPKNGSKVIDPACGCGNFLTHLLTQPRFENKQYKLVGADKDDFLAFVSNAYLTLLTQDKSDVFCINSLESFQKINKQTNSVIAEEEYDYIITNPPYGSKIDIGSDELKQQFDLAHKWKTNKETGEWERSKVLQAKPAPQIVFLERCIQLAKPGGYIGLVLPEGMFSNPSQAYVRDFLLRYCELEAIISFPEELFKTSGKGGTHTKTCAVILKKLNKRKEKNYPIFLGRAIKCGHDSRGLKTPHDDLPKIGEKYIDFKKGKDLVENHIGFTIQKDDIVNGIWLPKYYDPVLQTEIIALATTHEMVTLGDLIENGSLEIRAGDEVGKLAYGTGEIPFIRTSEISNWEIKTDNKHGLSQVIYEKYCRKQDVQCGDILMVRDGTYLVGSCAMVTADDLPLVYQSHLFKIRSLDHDKIDPNLLLATLSSPFLEKQIYSKRFTQDIIDTLGPRIRELVLPIPRSRKMRHKIIENVKRIIQIRNEARTISRSVRWDVLGRKYRESFTDIITKM